MEERVRLLTETYGLVKHPEGGSFTEVYTAPFECNGRPLMGNIYFMLVGDDLSHFHVIDCDELWFYHEGCGLKVIFLRDGKKEEVLLGKNVERGERAMVVIPKGTIFAAENLDKKSYTFLSCSTTPNFLYSGFRLVSDQELSRLYPDIFDSVKHFTFNPEEIADKQKDLH